MRQATPARDAEARGLNIHTIVGGINLIWNTSLPPVPGVLLPRHYLQNVPVLNQMLANRFSQSPGDARLPT
jgi:hypothetical protein